MGCVMNFRDKMSRPTGTSVIQVGRDILSRKPNFLETKNERINFIDPEPQINAR
jgi:hypothetical protein